MSILKRIKGKTPKFFVFLRRIGLSCSSLGAGLFGVKAQFSIQIISDAVAGQLITAGLIIAAISSLTIDDNDQKDKPKPLDESQS